MLPLLYLVYAANVLVAGWISISALFYPKRAHRTVFEQQFAYSEAIRLVGALWWAIFMLSILGLFFPYQMSLVLLFQLIYKGSWLLVAAYPAKKQGLALSKGDGHCFCPLGHYFTMGYSVDLFIFLIKKLGHC